MRRSHGFTLVELAVVLVVCVAVGVVIMAVLLPSIGRRNHGIRHLKDATQVRGIQQGLVLWSQNNRDRYPRPSSLDKDNMTIALAEGEDPSTKDTTSNIISILIYNGFIPPELCVSPAEVNGNIKVFDTYDYEAPAGAAAADKKLALWDPGFNADFTDPSRPGNFSYGHMLPAGERLAKQWMNTFSATEAVLGNRGPEIAGLGSPKGGVRPATLKNPTSNTLLIHGGRTTWEGNIAYNDNHVSFETRMDPEETPYSFDGKKTYLDHLFYDELDDAAGLNNFLSIVTKAGPARADFVSIWD
ncbi:MAG: hypothetical protein HBSAPP03_11590 [Phycisphaerae bacterium]|nr:MAG: hypothetical protein HBSAPP03_11590 [Phycisphaerae bacterium]